MNISPNFRFLAKEFPSEAKAATTAEGHAATDPRGSLVCCCRTSKKLVYRIYPTNVTLSKTVFQ